MTLEALILSIIIGLLRGGRLTNLGRIPIRHDWLLTIPAAIFLAACTTTLTHTTAKFMPYIQVANIVQYVVLIIAIVLNLHIRELWFVLIGAFSNFLAMVTNGGLMPMTASALKAAKMEQLIKTATSSASRHSIAGPETHLKWLVDIIPVPPPSFLPHRISMTLQEVASVGDVLVAIAVFVLVQRYMCRPKEVRRYTS
ncbi:MAG: DUF5317 domain-containing protein [Armatimonadota bacterium]